jgi:hypothetical protein
MEGSTQTRKEYNLNQQQDLDLEHKLNTADSETEIKIDQKKILDLTIPSFAGVRKLYFGQKLVTRYQNPA